MQTSPPAWAVSGTPKNESGGTEISVPPAQQIYHSPGLDQRPTGRNR